MFYRGNILLTSPLADNTWVQQLTDVLRDLCLASVSLSAAAGEGRRPLIATAAATRGRGGLMLGTTLVSTNTSFRPLTAVPHRGAEIRTGRGGGPGLTPRDSSTPGLGRGGEGKDGHIPLGKFHHPQHLSLDGLFLSAHFPCQHLSL